VKILVAAGYLLVVMLYTALTKFSIGLPLRTLVLVALSGLIFFAYNRESREFFERYSPFTWIFFVLGLIGTLLTYFREHNIGEALDGLTSVIIQCYLIFFCVLVLIRLLGIWPVALLTFAGAAFTGLFALLQFADIGIGWRLREIVSDIQHEPSSIRDYVEGRGRPMGMSLSPIVFSYHMVCTYMALNALYRFNYMSFFNYYAAFAAIAIVTLANGTRSALLGILVSEVVMELRRGTPRAFAKVAMIGAAGLVMYLYADATGSRVADTDDASALGRIVLLNYGLRLAADNPLGLGWDFNPAGYAWLYWEHLADFVNADGVYRLGLHNAFLNFFLIYGVGGMLVCLAILLYDPRFVFFGSLFLSSYAVHAVVHNNGIFLSDYFFWFNFAIMVKVFESQGIGFGTTVRAPVKPVFNQQRQWA
jgi:hypothetical protein